MNDQMKITRDGRVMGDHEHKVEMSIQRLKAFEPPDGYYVAFSGGKDSQCVYHLCNQQKKQPEQNRSSWCRLPR